MAWILQTIGRVIGFDRISLLFNTLEDTLRFFSATQLAIPIRADIVLRSEERDYIITI
ncbi:hypothetical protein NC651_037035 [Populus alba x Populus x berolinensis]|nr:hypothetical protein NC651_037035 [Populus alba x Populus x berolinensis]